jgi:glycosyltransferase involved in cell wall biosynthesis
VLVFAFEERFHRCPDGLIYSLNGFDGAFWDRYRQFFPEMRVLARVQSVEAPAAGAVPVPEGLSFHALPLFGPLRSPLNGPLLLSEVRRGLEGADAYAIRAPGLLSLLVERQVRRSGRPFAVELVGDPQAASAPGLVSPAVAAAGPFITRSTKRLCRTADAVSYVTRSYLQKRYPAASGALTGAFSDAILPPHLIRATPRPASFFADRPFRMLFVGSLQQPYKGADILFEAVRRLVARGFPLSLRVAGEGRLRAKLEQQIARQGLAGTVEFLGRISRNQVIAEMDACHLLIQPSRSEGLPRSIVEALGRGTPVLASDVGGISEIVSCEQLCPVGDPDALAEAIRRSLDQPELLAALSARNLLSARSIAPEVLAESFSAFWSAFRDLAAERPGLACR